MQPGWGSVRSARLYAKFYFTFWKRGGKTGNNPINILRLPDLHVHLLAVHAGPIGHSTCDNIIGSGGGTVLNCGKLVVVISQT